MWFHLYTMIYKRKYLTERIIIWKMFNYLFNSLPELSRFRYLQMAWLINSLKARRHDLRWISHFFGMCSFPFWKSSRRVIRSASVVFFLVRIHVHPMSSHALAKIELRYMQNGFLFKIVFFESNVWCFCLNACPRVRDFFSVWEAF